MITSLILTCYLLYRYTDFPQWIILVAIAEFIGWLYKRYRESEHLYFYSRYNNEIRALHSKIIAEREQHEA